MPILKALRKLTGMDKMQQVLGMDVGGSGIKAAPVDIRTGTLLAPRHRMPTPQPATPEAMLAVMAQLVRHFDWHGPVGVGFPAVIQQGVVRTASNIDSSWIGVSVARRLAALTGDPVSVVNDADAAGLAEMAFGAGQNISGAVLVLTIGTGIGSSLFMDGRLYPNTEFGQVLMEGMPAERYVSAKAREEAGLSWRKWGKRFDRYLHMVDFYTWPEMIVLGGGGSKKFDRYKDLITLQTPVVPAQLLNEAGIVGAAMAVLQQHD
jgi:polyphosphate glucokinase